MVFLAFVFVSFLAIWNLNFLMKMKTHDVVLFRFCDIRREIMKYLRDNSGSIAQEDYLEAKKLLSLLHIYIHFYDDCKTSVFNFRKYLEFAKEFQKNSKEISKIRNFKNPILEKIRGQICHATIDAFYAYTPYLKSALIFNLIKYIAKLTAWKTVTRFLLWLKGFEAYSSNLSPA